jgi:putative adhesin
MHVFDTPGKVALKIGLGGGQVSVETDDVGQTTVDVEALRDDEVTREAIAAMTIEARERGGVHEVVVEAPKRSQGWLGALGRGPKIGVRVRCPHDADVRVNTSSADIEVDGRSGDVEVNTASGDVSLEHVTGTLKVNSASGDVSVHEIGAAGAIKTASGDVRVQRAHGTLSANLVSGDFELGEAFDDISIATVSGDQEVAALRGGERAKVQSVSGDVRVGIAPGLRLWIDGSSVSGSIRSDLELEDAPADEEGPVVELRARTVSGDVQIVRAAHVV